MLCLAIQSCLTLCNPIDCSPPGTSVHGDSPGKNTGVGCHALLQGIFPTQESNQGLLHFRQILYQLSYQGSPEFTICGLKRTGIWILILGNGFSFLNLSGSSINSYVIEAEIAVPITPPPPEATSFNILECFFFPSALYSLFSFHVSSLMIHVE